MTTSCYNGHLRVSGEGPLAVGTVVGVRRGRLQLVSGRGGTTSCRDCSLCQERGTTVCHEGGG